jgi:hypothetical protein
MHQHKVRADFNGLFGDILCLSHGDTCVDESGVVVRLHEGLILTAYDEDVDEHGKRDDLITRGKVEPSPEWLECHGSKWVLRIDENGVIHESDLHESDWATTPDTLL